MTSLRLAEKGNVFFAIFGAVAIVGMLGAGISTFVGGPISSAVTVTRESAAENQMVIGAQSAVMGAKSQAGSGDCDADLSVEPVGWRLVSGSSGPVVIKNGSTLTQATLVPNSVAAPKRDPWGTDYGYCVWDHGSRVDDAACGGTSQNRLAGTNSRSYPALALISAGPDQTFQTTCRDFTAADVNADGDLDDAGDYKLVQKTVGSDDLIFSYTYDEAVAASGDLWQLRSANTAGIDKKLEIAGGADFSGTGDFIGITADSIAANAASFVSMPGVRVPDSSVYNPTCNVGLTGVVRSNLSSVENRAAVVSRTEPAVKVDSADTASVQFFSRPQAGNAIIVSLRLSVPSGGSVMPAGSVTDNHGNVYTDIVHSGTNADSDRVFLFAAYGITTGSGDFIITANPSGTSSSITMSAIEVRGINSSSLNLTGVSAANNGSVSAAGTTSTNNELAVAAIGIFDATNENRALSAGANWTQESVYNLYVPMSTVTRRYQASGASVSHTWGYDSSGTILSIAKVVATFRPVSIADCPAGYTSYGGHCYKKYDPGQTWAQARATCQADGADLAIINDGAENAFLATLFSTSDALINYTDSAVEGTFVWGDPSATYSNWAAGEPNGGAAIDCGTIWKSGTPANAIADYSCNGTTASSICEYIPGSGSGAVSGSMSMTVDSSRTGTYDLTADNPTDWALWYNTANGTPDIRRNGGGSIIPAVTLTNGGTFLNHTSYPRTITWTGGTPTGSGSSTRGVFINTANAAIGKGMQIVLPADTTMRTVKLYMSYYNVSTVTVTATLSDGSAAQVVNTSLLTAIGQVNDEGSGVITLNYNAASAGQTLTLRWEITAGSSDGDISVNAVSIKEGAVVPPGTGATCDLGERTPVAQTKRIQYVSSTMGSAQGGCSTVDLQVPAPSGIQAGDFILIAQSSDYGGNFVDFPIGFKTGGILGFAFDGQATAWAWKIASGLETNFDFGNYGFTNSCDVQTIITVYRNVDTMDPIIAQTTGIDSIHGAPWNYTAEGVSTEKAEDGFVVIGVADTDGTFAGTAGKLFTFGSNLQEREQAGSVSGWSPIALADDLTAPIGAVSGSYELTNNGNAGQLQLGGYIIALRASTHVGSCQPGYVFFEDKCYKVGNAGQNWASARASCQADGGDLATISSMAEQYFLYGMWQNDSTDIAWVGYNDQAVEGNWVWANGETTNFANEPFQTCAMAPEGGYAVLNITNDGNISAIDFASFGTPGGYCGNFVQSACHDANSVSVASSCIGQPNCPIEASTSNFGDPCWGVMKGLYVQATTSKNSNWANGEPNADGDCGVMWSYRDGRFADHDCNATTPRTLCEAPVETAYGGGESGSTYNPAAAPAPNAPVFRSSTVAYATNGAVNVTKPTNNTGDLLIWTVVLDGPAVPASISWPYGFTQINSAYVAAPDSQTIAIAYKVTDGSEPATLVGNFGSGYDTVSAVSRYTGFDTVQPIETSRSILQTGQLAWSASWSVSLPSITTTVNNARVVWAVASDHTGLPPDYPDRYSPPPDFRLRLEQRASGWLDFGQADRIFPTAGATGVLTGTVYDTYASAAGSPYDIAFAGLAFAIRPGSGGGSSDQAGPIEFVDKVSVSSIFDVQRTINLSIPVPSTVLAGDFMLLMIQATNVPGALTVPAGFTLGQSLPLDSSWSTVRWYWKLADGTETSLNVVATNTEVLGSSLTLYRGVDQDDPVGAKNGYVEPARHDQPFPYNAPSITVANNNSSVIMIPYFGGEFPLDVRYGAKVFTAPDAFIERVNGYGSSDGNGFVPHAVFDSMGVSAGATGPITGGYFLHGAIDSTGGGYQGQSGVFIFALNADDGSGGGPTDNGEIVEPTCINSLLQVCDGTGWKNLPGGAASTYSAPQSSSSVCNSGASSSIRYNTSSGRPEYCDGASWRPFVMNESGVVLKATALGTPSPAIITDMDSAADISYSGSGPEYSHWYNVEVKNLGSVTSAPISISLTGTDPTRFVFGPATPTPYCDGLALEPGAVCYIAVASHATIDGTFSANLAVTDGSNSSYVALFGTATGHATCAPGKLGFGGIIVSCLDNTTPYYVLTGAGCANSTSEPACTNTTGGVNDDPSSLNYSGQPSWMYNGANEGLINNLAGDINTSNLSTYNYNTNSNYSSGEWPAAAYCYNLVKGGYTNWYLPSTDEWEKIIYPLRSILNFSDTEPLYWTSTYDTYSYAWGWDASGAFNISDGWIEGHYGTTNQANIRCLRKHSVAFPSAGSDTRPFKLRWQYIIPPLYTTTLNATVTSAQGRITGINAGTPITMSNWDAQFRTYSSWSGAWTGWGTTGTAYPGDLIEARVTSPASTGQERLLNLVIGAENYVWRVRTVQAATKQIFATSLRYNGNLGGFSGADALCQTRATAAGLGTNWYAFIGGNGVSAFERIPWNWNRLNNMAGTKVVDYLGDLEETLTNNLAKVNRTESNATFTTNTDVWTGMVVGIGDRMTSYDDGIHNSGDDCFNGSNAAGAWTSNSSSLTGTTGDGNAAVADGGAWLARYTTLSCNQQARLYCIGPFGASDR